MEEAPTLVMDFAVSPAEKHDITLLLQACFPGAYPARPYYKQLPAMRLLLRDGRRPVAHLALEHRMIRAGEDPWRIFGVVDLCVHPDHRRRGLAGQLLAHVEELGRRHGAEAVVLFADDARVYERAGYRRVGNRCRWLAVHEHRSLGIKEDSLADCMMVRTLCDRRWDDRASVDLLGTLF